MKSGIEETKDLEPFLIRMKEATPGSDYLLKENKIILKLGNIRSRIDQQTVALINSHEYGLLTDSHQKTCELIGNGDSIIANEEKQLCVTTNPEEILSFFIDTAKKGLYIQRYKGLGEMNPEQLWETTMQPENRLLLQVKIEDVVEAEEIFTVLMGDQVEPRREFIEQNALNVSNLDI